MFAKYLYLEDALDESHPEKPWLRGKLLCRMREVWDALAKLDGDRFSILIVAEGSPTAESEVPFSGKALAIAGGKEGHYLCEAYIKEDYTPTTVRNPDVPESCLDMVPLKRGQLEHFSRRLIVGRDAVREALAAFVKRGELSDKLIWEKRE